MKSLNRAMLIVVLVLVAMVSVACGGGGSSTGAGKPEDAAKTWIESLFKGDGTALRNVTCDDQKAGITDDMVSQMQTAFTTGGATIDYSALTYTYDSATKSVTVGGNIKVTVAGVSQDAPVPFPALPMLEEGGGWKVCAPLS